MFLSKPHRFLPRIGAGRQPCPNPIQFLPLAAQRQQRAYLEATGGDVERVRDLRSFVEIAAHFPVLVAVTLAIT